MLLIVKPQADLLPSLRLNLHDSNNHPEAGQCLQTSSMGQSNLAWPFTGHVVRETTGFAVTVHRGSKRIIPAVRRVTLYIGPTNWISQFWDFQRFIASSYSFFFNLLPHQSTALILLGAMSAKICPTRTKNTHPEH